VANGNIAISVAGQPNVLVVANSGAVITGNASISGTASVVNLKVSDLYSQRNSVAVTSNTVVDSFAIAEFRSAKYTIKANSDLGYQALEVLLVHDDINSIITVYGSLSTTGNDIVVMSTAVNSGDVELKATGVGANTSLNLMGTYVPD